MTAFSDAFRAEVVRMTRKEIKGEVKSLRKTVTQQRSEIAALKQDIKALATQIKVLRKAATAAQPGTGKTARQAEAAPSRRTRGFKFDPQALTAKREQLGISKQAMAALLEASALSLYKWEGGKATPRAAQLERIQAVLKMGKREALAKLQP